jgi:hypothetical protein
MKKVASGPDLYDGHGRTYHVIDVEAGGGGGGAAHPAASPLLQRHATVSPLSERFAGLASGTAGPSPAGAFAAYSAGPSPALSAGGAAARRARSLQAVAGTSYVISSAALILLNKKVLVHYHFRAVHALLFYHCL